MLSRDGGAVLQAARKVLKVREFRLLHNPTAHSVPRGLLPPGPGPSASCSETELYIGLLSPRVMHTLGVMQSSSLP